MKYVVFWNATPCGSYNKQEPHGVNIPEDGILHDLSVCAGEDKSALHPEVNLIEGN
jgi:hypothetical protein